MYILYSGFAEFHKEFQFEDQEVPVYTQANFLFLRKVTSRFDIGIDIILSDLPISVIHTISVFQQFTHTLCSLECILFSRNVQSLGSSKSQVDLDPVVEVRDARVVRSDGHVAVSASAGSDASEHAVSVGVNARHGAARISLNTVYTQRV